MISKNNRTTRESYNLVKVDSNKIGKLIRKEIRLKRSKIVTKAKIRSLSKRNPLTRNVLIRSPLGRNHSRRSLLLSKKGHHLINLKKILPIRKTIRRNLRRGVDLKIKKRG
jgi:hypothetical protein